MNGDVGGNRLELGAKRSEMELNLDASRPSLSEFGEFSRPFPFRMLVR